MNIAIDTLVTGDVLYKEKDEDFWIKRNPIIPAAYLTDPGGTSTQMELKTLVPSPSAGVDYFPTVGGNNLRYAVGNKKVKFTWDSTLGRWKCGSGN